MQRLERDEEHQWLRQDDDLSSFGSRRRLWHSANWRSTRRYQSPQSPPCLPSASQLGNYLGALSNWVRLQQNAHPDDTLLYMVVGWHAMTLPQNPKELASSRWDMLATLLAVGLDPKRSVIFHQEDVRLAHSPTYSVSNKTRNRTRTMSSSPGFSIVLHQSEGCSG